MTAPPALPCIDEHALPADPIGLFREWLAAATEAGLPFPEAMTLATATAAGAPSARIVLLKGVEDEGGFLFFTSYESRKGSELEENPRAALVFHWQPLGRQVRVEGDVSRASRAESYAYFRTRPRGSRIGAWASPQSGPIASRAELEARVAEIDTRYPGENIPLPSSWGGYRLVPRALEFWQHGADRLHDRFLFRREEDGWSAIRIAP